MRRKIQQPAIPVMVHLVKGESHTSFPFSGPDVPVDQSWSFVLDMADDPDPYHPVRVGKDLHLIASPHAQWGTA